MNCKNCIKSSPLILNQVLCHKDLERQDGNATEPCFTQERRYKEVIGLKASLKIKTFNKKYHEK